MRVEFQIRDGVGIIRPEGRFVTGCEAALESTRNYLQETGITKAVLDLSQVPYVDSTGLAFVVELHKWLSSCEGQLVLTNANERVREVLRLTRISEIVPTFDNAEDAECELRGEVVC
jgi:anti-sigma B factor antagonist